VSDTVEWRWIDVGGEQHVVRFDELSEALAGGSLPPYVLVWRTGWPEWLPAANVPELSFAIGVDNSGPPSLVRTNPALTAPPAPPFARYSALGPNPPKTLYEARPDSWPSSVPPPPPRARALPRPKAVGVPPPPAFLSGPIPIRDVMPTLHEEEPARSPTLRPAGALPPPPRIIPPPKAPVFEPLEVKPAGEATKDDSGDFPVLPEAPRPPIAHAVPPLPEVARLPPSSPVTTEVVEIRPAVAARPPPSPAGRPGTGGGLSRETIARFTSAGLLLPGGLLLALALLRPGRHRSEETAKAAVTASAAPAPPPVPPAGCIIEKPAQRLAPVAFAGVPPVVAVAPDGRHVAIGVATSKDHALGLLLDPAALTAEVGFDQTSAEGAVLGVVPLVHAKTLAFAVDRADAKLAFSRTVDAATPFSIGVGPEGFSRLTGDTLSVIWPGKSPNPTITTPRVATVQGTGHAVVFRHGGQEGKVLAGWLHEDGTALANLKAVGTDATLAGTPTVSANDGAVLVAFASKLSASEPWRVELATAAHGALPERASVFQVPAGGPGGEAISPSSEGLTKDRFLLQWTEGSAGNRAVRVQILTGDLVPQGEPITLSSPEQNAGQGALFVQGTRAVAMFLVKQETTHELWGATLTCQ
jgi:hypothetical protein